MTPSMPWALACLLLAQGAAAQGPSAQVRLEVGWISREPRMPPPNSTKAPIEEGWPDPGSTVRWIAHVLNRGTPTTAAVPYAWRIDGEIVASGRLRFAPGETEVPLPRRWTSRRELISFEIQPPPAVGDATPDDDQVTVASDALSIGFWVERDAYDWLAADGRPGFERWAAREIESWNRILARAVYPSTPQGVLDRLRLESVVVLPNGGWPRNDELVTDLYWVFPNTGHDGRFPQVGVYPSDSTIVLHELLHQRGLIDLYAYTVIHGDRSSTDSRVDITENGRPVAGTFLMPALAELFPDGLRLYDTPLRGLMGAQYVATANLTEQCANGLNLRAGHRTPIWFDKWGNVINGYSAVADPDGYVWRLPRQTEVDLVDQDGAPITGAMVDVFLDHSPDTYQKRYATSPDRIFQADSRGVAVLPGDVLQRMPPASAPVKAQVIILGVRTSRGRGFAFLPVSDLNLLYFRGGRERAETVLRVTLHPW